MALRRVPGTALTDGTDRGDANRRLFRAARPGHHDLRSQHRAPAGNARRTRSVPWQCHPDKPAQSSRSQRPELLPAAEPGWKRAGSEQLLLHEPAYRRFLLDLNARGSPADRQTADLRALYAQRSHRGAKRVVRIGQRYQAAWQFPDPQERWRDLRPRLHDVPLVAVQPARRLAAF